MLAQVYNLKDIAEEIALPGATFIGAGAGSSRLTGTNCELMPNSNLATNDICTHFAKLKVRGVCACVCVYDAYMSSECS